MKSSFFFFLERERNRDIIAMIIIIYKKINKFKQILTKKQTKKSSHKQR